MNHTTRVNFSTWQRFFETATNRDVLDLVTVAYDFLARLTHGREIYARQWVLDVEKIFSASITGLI